MLKLEESAEYSGFLKKKNAGTQCLLAIISGYIDILCQNLPLLPVTSTPYSFTIYLISLLYDSPLDILR